ncbi:hypothetical protein F2Q69_00036103 [Brassica cretica]|uniref:Uncharacterized protein n=1 Tax=Brassica cretica TaxID=69181 RepID=A0A8S9SGG6_BRACR|nr:hypothetical protein F2Q69_00036103 [Brassica cretica]
MSLSNSSQIAMVLECGVQRLRHLCPPWLGLPAFQLVAQSHSRRRVLTTAEIVLQKLTTTEILLQKFTMAEIYGGVRLKKIQRWK